MFLDFKARALAGTLLLTASFAQAQAPTPLPTHAVRSINPTDADFRDLEFLKAEIGPARVVMLGEPSHGEGDVFEAKIRLMRFLREQMGFTTVAFESGFYDLHKAQQALEAGRPAQEAIGSSVFSIWTSTQEFQGILPLLGKSGLRVTGFDPQLMSDGYSGDMVDDLEEFLASDKGAVLLNYEYLEQVIGFMGEHFAFVPTTTLPEFEKEMAKAARLVDKAASSPDPKRHTEATFWQQNLRSLLAQARDYATNAPELKTKETFKASDNNPRDAQMADNLLWYLRQHPTEKVVCWGALPHFANQVGVLNNEELRSYQPMGQVVKAALPPGHVYLLGTLAGGGRHGLPGTTGAPVPPPAAGTLEASLLALDTPFAFVSLQHDAPGRQLTTYAFDYQPLAGPWSEVVDGFLFLRSVEPPHLLTDGTAVLADSTSGQATLAQPGSANPLPGRAGATMRRVVAVADVSGLRSVRGVVLDQRRTPVPYASVELAGQGRGTVADANGHFALALPGPTTLRVSSLGYAAVVVQSPPGTEELTVVLTPARYALAEVRVASPPLNPQTILKNVIRNIPANYEQQDYANEVYAHRRLSNFDTLRYEVETVSREWVPAGYRHYAQGFLMLEPGPTRQVEQQHVLAGAVPKDYSAGANGLAGPVGSPADPVRISPLFVARNLRKFTLKLDSVRQQGAETLYVLSFAARHADHRSTGAYLAGVYQGQLVVRQHDYAVLRYEALWQVDTANYNGVARHNQQKTNLVARLYAQVLTTSRTTHVVEYAKGENNRYYARHSLGQALSAGRVLKSRQSFYYQSSNEQFFKPLPGAGPAPVAPAPPKGSPPPTPPEVPYRPEFWNGYQRPGGALATPEARP